MILFIGSKTAKTRDPVLRHLPDFKSRKMVSHHVAIGCYYEYDTIDDPMLLLCHDFAKEAHDMTNATVTLRNGHARVHITECMYL